jgi:hypothetical protein
MTEKKFISQFDKDLGLSMIKTLSSSEIPHITQDMVEVGLDAILQNGILRDIPVISTITGIAKTVISVRDKLLIRKIASFLFELQNVTDKERGKFINDMNSEPNYQRKVGENLLMLLERLDDLDKPILIAKIFRAYLRSDIDYRQFLRFSSVVDQMLIYDLQDLLNAILQKNRYDKYAEYLYPYGLSQIVFDDTTFLKAGSSLKGAIQSVSRPVFFPQENALQFQLTEMTFLLAQILLEKRIGDKDYIAENHRKLEYTDKN